MTERSAPDELDRALERALAVAAQYVKRPRSEALLGRLLSASDMCAGRGWTIPPRAMPLQVLEAAADPDEWFARFYDPLRLGVLEVFLHRELTEWQPLVDQTLAAFRRGEHPIVLVGGLAILDSVMARATMRRDVALKALAASPLTMTESDWGLSQRHVLAWSLDAAVARLRPSGSPEGARHWTLEGRDSPAGWTREDALKVLNAVGTAAALLPEQLHRDAPARVSMGPTPTTTTTTKDPSL